MDSDKKILKTDWVLLLCLLLFTNQAMFSLKIVGIVLIYILRPNFKFGFFKGRVPKFFFLIMLLALFNWLFLIRDFTLPYLVAFIAGNTLWMLSFLSFHQLKLSIERYGVATADRTLRLFVVVHFLFCVGQLVRIMFITGQLNPYVGLPFPYGMSTGDNIFGAFMENSLYNVTVSTFLTIYFIYRKKLLYALLAASCVIFVFSNFGSIVFTGIMVGLFLAGIINAITGKKYVFFKKISPPGNFALYIPFFLGFMTFIYVTVSPQNAEYLVAKIKAKIFSIETAGKNNYKTLIADQAIDPKAYDIYLDDYLEKKMEAYRKEKGIYFSDVVVKKPATKEELVDVKRDMSRLYIYRLQGKSLAVLETSQYLKSSPKAFIFGAGTTRFSSQIAQKMAGYDSSRLFMNVLPHFSSPEYETNHMLLIEERIKSDEQYYSTANFPDSFYNKIFGEYGVLGALLFLVFYVGYFLKDFRYLTYGLWLFVVIIPFAHLSYIFDTLCVMPFFEWLLLIDIGRNKAQQ